IMELGDGLLLEKWYHIAYTLSDSEKRLDVYIDGEWLGFYSIQDFKKQRVIFNDGPLYIGKAYDLGFNGEIRNVRNFNWRLSAGEKKPIVYGSKVALIHVPTGKYLSTKGVKYDLGPNNKQYMVICSGKEIDLVKDVWTIVGAHDESVNMGNSVLFNSIIGFKHQATNLCLHSHGTGAGVTPKSNSQQVTLCPGRGGDNDWLVRRFGPDTSYSHLTNEDVINLFHIATNKPALCSHSVILNDGSQEVCCNGDGSDEKNMWLIKLIE
ncbi:5554_t:CDS:2, partial [Dentiscutata heterogama]